MDITKGDWVVDHEGDVGQVDKITHNVELDPNEYEAENTEVWCRWLHWRHSEGWKKQKPTWVCEENIVSVSKKRLEAKAVATIIKSIIYEKE